MATYKVIQDIEAEDKLLGPLSMRQFIYAVIALFSAFLVFQFAQLHLLAGIPFLLPMALFGLLAAPFGKDQPSEIWLLAKIRFILKPQRRIWDQSGVKELVTIAVPKTEEHHYSDGLSQTEVKSRLSALANTLDSRGWAVKNVDSSTYSQPLLNRAGEDRLISPNTLPTNVPDYSLQQATDILDEKTNPTAQHFNKMINQSSQNRRQQVIEKMHPGSQPSATTSPPADYWFMNQPTNQQPGFTTGSNAAVIPGQTNNKTIAATQNEKQLLEKAKHQQQIQDSAYKNGQKNIQPLSGQKVPTPSPQTTPTPQDDTSVTAKHNPDILRLANNDDLNVATIAREANKKPDNDEVVISLH